MKSYPLAARRRKPPGPPQLTGGAPVLGALSVALCYAC